MCASHDLFPLTISLHVKYFKYSVVCGLHQTRHETRPVSTGRGTRRVQLVREGGGGVRPGTTETTLWSADSARFLRAPFAQSREWERIDTCPISTGRGTRRVHLVRGGGGGGNAWETDTSNDRQSQIAERKTGDGRGPGDHSREAG